MLDLLRTLSPLRERLSPLDASFLYLEKPTELLHVGALATLDGAVPFERFAATLGERLGRLRRYRQRPLRPPLDLGAPGWHDDPTFDPARHVRRVTVPAPGGERELHRAVDELFAAPLDPRYPLWETHLLEGLAGGRAAVLCKVHHCMIDGVSGAQVLEIMTDAGPGAAAAPALPTAGQGAPAGARDGVRTALAAAASPGRALARLWDTAGAAGLVATLVREPAAPLPFNGPLSGERRIRWASFALDDFLALRGAAGCKVNDVVLAVIAGALRRYLRARGLTGPLPSIRTLVPVNVRRDDERLTLGNRVSGMFAVLPADVADPAERLARVAAEMRRLKESGQRRAFDLVLDLAAWLPPPAGPFLGWLGARWPVVHTVCTNVPGSRDPRWLLGRRVVDIHPIVPLALGIGLGFAILSYDGKLSIAATADPALVPDVECLPGALAAELADLAARFGHRAARPAAAPPGARPAAALPGARPAAGGRRAAGAPAPTVGDLMTREVATLAPTDSLARAWETMRDRRIRHLPVVDGDGRLLGIVTHRDLLAASQSSLSFRLEQERVRLLGWARAEDVMETHLSTARPDEAAAEAGRRMVRHKLGCLPVVAEDGRLAGIVTEEDFLRWATEHMTATEVADVDLRAEAAALGRPA